MNRICLFLFLFSITIGAGAMTAAAGRAAGDLQTVRLQLKWKHQFLFAGYYAAIEKGFYRDTSNLA
jgi:ABC-type nitrate/sulfonate/bicarbonate transport system substrate-binding protein